MSEKLKPCPFCGHNDFGIMQNKSSVWVVGQIQGHEIIIGEKTLKKDIINALEKELTSAQKELEAYNQRAQDEKEECRELERLKNKYEN